MWKFFPIFPILLIIIFPIFLTLFPDLCKLDNLTLLNHNLHVFAPVSKGNKYSPIHALLFLLEKLEIKN